MRRSSSASAQSTAPSRATFARSNRKRMRAQFCRSASGTWASTPRSSTCTAWGGPYTVPERWRRLTTRCRRRGPASLIHRRWFAVVATPVEASRGMHRLARAPERGSLYVQGGAKVRTVHQIGFMVAAVILMGGMQTGKLFAQDDARRALLGTWEGTVFQGSASGPVRLDFSEKKGELLWKWSWQASWGKGEAEGIVTRYAPPRVELSGRYTLHPSVGVQGSTINMSLTVSGSLKGDG